MSLVMKQPAGRPFCWKRWVFDQFVVHSWWVLLFIGIAYCFHLRGVHRKTMLCEELSSRMRQMQHVRFQALLEREDLLLQIESQKDPDWIQMVLMKGLGVVPEGQTKVYFPSSK